MISPPSVPPLAKLCSAPIAALAIAFLCTASPVLCQAAPSTAGEKPTQAAAGEPSGKSNQATAKGKTSRAGSTTGVKSQTLLTADQAKKLVEARPEVKEWLTLFKKAGAKAHPDSKPVIEVEKDGKNWNVHVFEALPDHTATFNWYSVDPATKKISPMF